MGIWSATWIGPTDEYDGDRNKRQVASVAANQAWLGVVAQTNEDQKDGLRMAGRKQYVRMP